MYWNTKKFVLCELGNQKSLGFLYGLQAQMLQAP